MLLLSAAPFAALGQAREFDVRIARPDAELVLAGTLSLPGGDGPHPAALLLTGSGGHTRDQVISGFPMFQELARVLTEQGIAVLRVDDRGTGESTGPGARESTTLEHSYDAEAAWHLLADRPEIDARRVGLLGHSEGTLTAALLAGRVPEVAFTVLLSPFAIPGADLWVRQQGDILRREGEMDAEQIARIESALKAMVEHIGTGGNTDEGFYRTGREACIAWGDPPEEVTPEFVTEAFGDLRQRWYEYFFSSDPAAAFGKLKVPTLAIFGTADVQVPVETNAPLLLGSLLAAGNDDFEIVVLPEEDHFFMTGDGLAPNEHRSGKMRFSDAMLRRLEGWIGDRLIGLTALSARP